MWFERVLVLKASAATSGEATWWRHFRLRCFVSDFPRTWSFLAFFCQSKSFDQGLGVNALMTCVMTSLMMTGRTWVLFWSSNQPTAREDGDLSGRAGFESRDKLGFLEVQSINSHWMQCFLQRMCHRMVNTLFLLSFLPSSVFKNIANYILQNRIVPRKENKSNKEH